MRAGGRLDEVALRSAFGTTIAESGPPMLPADLRASLEPVARLPFRD
jgi:hypothetical protein